MNSLFSVFEPVSWFGLSLNWVVCLLVLFLVLSPSKFWAVGSSHFFSVRVFLGLILSNVSSSFSPKNFPGAGLVVLSVFCYIFCNNFMGNFPYVFSSTSHFIFGVSLALPLWLGYMIYSYLKQPTYMLSMMLPGGSPGALVVMLVLIELVSNLIRPLTLCIRLAANMMAGHLLLSLLGSSISMSPMVVLIVTGLVMLVVLELCVSLIQAYVFSMLVGLYSAEANSVCMHLS